MPEPLRIPVSPFQLARFADFQRDAAAVNARLNDAVTTIVASQVDPASVRGWDIRLVGNEIVCTPPTKPALVPDIGPSGVSEAAAVG